MRVANVRFQRFRGLLSAQFTAPGHVVLVGEPRAGRTTVIEGLRKVLDPRSTSSRVDPFDIHRPLPATEEPAPLTEVEVALVDLGSDLEQLLNDYLEIIDPTSGQIADDTNPDGVLGVRLCYRARYDDDSDTGEHWVDWPKRSDPATGTFARARRVEREALPWLFIKRGAPLQVRAEGAFRGLMEDEDDTATADAIQELKDDVATATTDFSEATIVADSILKVLGSGATDLLGIADADQVTFSPDDGSLAGLLRSLQPMLDLDAAGFLPLTSHGSTASAVLSASEAVTAAAHVPDGLVVAVDDFGDELDSAASEHLAVLLRRGSSQLWASTRRPEVLRAFEPEELLRLTCRAGQRRQHRLTPTTDRKARRARRDLLEQLLNAITARTIVLMEGPHDVEGYGALAARTARSTKPGLPVLAAHATRLVCAPGEHGGKDVLPQLAALATNLGFEVRAVLDDDKPGTNTALFNTMETATHQLVVLPPRCAVEAAVVRGLPVDVLRTALEQLNESYDLGLAVKGISDADLEDTILTKKVLKMKGGLHKPWVESLRSRRPRIAMQVLRAICSNQTGRVTLTHGK